MLKFLNFSLKFIIIFFAILYFLFFQLYGIFQLVYLIIKNYLIINHQFQVEFTQKIDKLIAEYALEKRLFIPIESIPDKVIMLSFCRG
jgi:membrane carboxypeptidase/penicillin-binding protein